MLMRGTTTPTTRSQSHQSRTIENPPNQQPATVGEEERGGRDPTSRRTSMRAASYCRTPPTALHASQPRSSTSHPPQQQDTVHCAPARGRGPAPAQETEIHDARVAGDSNTPSSNLQRLKYIESEPSATQTRGARAASDSNMRCTSRRQLKCVVSEQQRWGGGGRVIQSKLIAMRWTLWRDACCPVP